MPRSILPLLLALVAHAAVALDFPPPAPVLPPPTGNVVKVDSSEGLQQAVASLASNTTIMLAPGTYHIQGERLFISNGVQHVAIRGATGKRDDVIVVGEGMGVGCEDCFQVDAAQDVTFADMSIGQVCCHPIKIDADAGADHILIQNCRLFDAGQQFIKGCPHPDQTEYTGEVAYCVFEYTQTGPVGGYTQGVDIHRGKNWHIHHNLFRNIRSPDTLAGAAVLMWNGSVNPVCEDNVIYDCQVGISFGLMEKEGFHDCNGGVIRNNVFYLPPGSDGDVAIQVDDCPGTLVEHNTCLESGAYGNAIEYRFAGSTDVVVRNNLCDAAISDRDGASARDVSGNVLDAQPGWFVDAAGGDFHLRSGSPAIDRGVPDPAGTLDIDGGVRTGTPDAGADEFGVAGSDSNARSTGRTAAKTEAKEAKITAKPQAKITAKPQAAPVSATADPQALAEQSASLRARLSALIDEGHPPVFQPAGTSEAASVEKIADDQITLKMSTGSIDLPWSTLKPGDLAQLASYRIRNDHPEDYAVAGFFLLLAGDTAKADDALREAGDRAEAIRAAFVAH